MRNGIKSFSKYLDRIICQFVYIHTLKLDYCKFITLDLSDKCLLYLGLYFKDKYKKNNMYAFMVNYESDISVFNESFDYKVGVERVKNDGIENIVITELTKKTR